MVRLCYVMLCYVMLCYVIFVMLCYVRLGQVRLGQVRLGQVMLCYVMLGQVRIGQVRLGYIMLCYVMLGQVRLGQVRLGQVRLCYVMLGQVRLCYVIQMRQVVWLILYENWIEKFNLFTYYYQECLYLIADWPANSRCVVIKCAKCDQKILRIKQNIFVLYYIYYIKQHTDMIDVVLKYVNKSCSA